MRIQTIITFSIIIIFNLISYSEGISMNKKDNTAKAYFAGGCFWGVEYLFEHKDGVISATSGYMGGSLDNPTYNDISHGDSGHIEAVKIEYDPAIVSYEELTKFFFEIHDPTQENRQGPDIGNQYASAIFYGNEEEKIIIYKLIDILKSKGYKIVTKVIEETTFWDAEDYHQNYYDKKKSQPYCHAYKKKF